VGWTHGRLKYRHGSDGTRVVCGSLLQSVAACGSLLHSVAARVAGTLALVVLNIIMVRMVNVLCVAVCCSVSQFVAV